MKVISIVRLADSRLKRIESLDQKISVTNAGGWFDAEIRATWPDYATRHYMSARPPIHKSTAELDNILADADIVLGGWPYPLDLRSRAPKLKWFHQLPAGASNLKRGDLWDNGVIVTTSRGAAASLPIAEHILAGIFHFAKSFPQAVADEAEGLFHKDNYAPLLINGKTICIVGAGGIGMELGRLCASLGMTVTGTRSRPVDAGDLPEGFSEIAGPDDLHRLLEGSDVVAVCCQLTPATEGLFDTAAFAALKDDAILVNIARGEIINEAALLAAVDNGTLRGAALDVYTGEFEHPPSVPLWSHPKIFITPHTSNKSDGYPARALDVFYKNLAAFIAGDEMTNVIDWERGY